MYYLLYCHPEEGNRWETIYGKDAMQERVSELVNEFGLDPEHILVFDVVDEIDHK